MERDLHAGVGFFAYRAVVIADRWEREPGPAVDLYDMDHEIVAHFVADRAAVVADRWGQDLDAAVARAAVARAVVAHAVVVLAAVDLEELGLDVVVQTNTFRCRQDQDVVVVHVVEVCDLVSSKSVDHQRGRPSHAAHWGRWDSDQPFEQVPTNLAHCDWLCSASSHVVDYRSVVLHYHHDCALHWRLTSHPDFDPVFSTVELHHGFHRDQFRHHGWYQRFRCSFWLDHFVVPVRYLQPRPKLLEQVEDD